MDFWNPKQTLEKSLPPSGGIVVLWHDPNIFVKTPWRVEGVYGQDIFSYFFIPPGFIIENNMFYYNDPFAYEEKTIPVTGYIGHDGQRWLQDGKTDPHWHIVPAELSTADLQTCPTTKLPFLQVPDRGRPGFKPESRFFIPLGLDT